jgi:integrase/recombinase XerD
MADSTKYQLHRRHLAECPHLAKGWNYTACECPIWFDGKIDGKRVRKSLDTTDMDRAMRRADRMAKGIEQDFCEGASGRTLQNAITQYLDDAAGRNLKPRSIESIRGTLTQLSAFCGPLRLNQLSSDLLLRFRDRRESKPRTKCKEVEHLRAFCALCLEREWIEKNWAKAVKTPLIADVATLPYTRHEIDKMLRACDTLGGKYASNEVRERGRAVLLTLLFTGLRISDVATLERGALEPSGHLVLRTTKTNVPIKVLLNLDAVRALEALPAPGGNPKYFFWSGVGDVKNTCSVSLWRTVSRIGELAGVHAYPHRFRDTFAVELLSAGADIRTVQKLLGHESVKTTEKHYAHFVREHQEILDRAVAALNFTPRPARPLPVSRIGNHRRNA